MEETLGQRIAIALFEKELTQAKLADLLGMNHSTVSMWISDKRKPNYPILKKIAEITNKPIEYFISYDEIADEVSMESLAKNIHLAMVSAGINQRTLADKLGVHQTAVSAWIHGRHKPSYSTLKQIAEFTGKDIGYFFYETIEPKTNKVNNKINLPTLEQIEVMKAVFTTEEIKAIVSQMIGYKPEKEAQQ